MPISRRTLAGLFACLAIWGLPVGCGDSGGGTTRPKGPVNVVIFLIDTLRADFLGTYGHDGPTSPRMDELARHGVVFEQANTPAPWTLPAVASLKLSQPICEHSVLADGHRIADTADPLAARLQRAGYRTASFHYNPYAGAISGLDRGYEHAEMVQQQFRGDYIAPWLAGLGAAPAFLYLHNTEPHDPFLVPSDLVAPFGEVPEADRRRFQTLSTFYRKLTRVDFALGKPVGTTDNSAEQQRILRQMDALAPSARILYEASVLWADQGLGTVIDTLKAQGRWDNTLFILMSDHGEEMGEHGMWQHDQSVHQELVHVPLVIRFPGDAFSGRRVSEPVSLIDVMPTILDYLERPDLATELRGRSLMPAVRGERQADTGPRVTAMRHNLKKHDRLNVERRGNRNVVVREGNWKAIWNTDLDAVELYDLEADPDETHDMSTGDPERAAAMGGFARAWFDACRTAGADADSLQANPEMDEATRTRLRSLGYVGGDG